MNNNNPTPTQSFIAFDDITDELKNILYRTALADFMANFDESNVDAILTVLENSPPDDFAGTAGRGDENNPNSDLFTVCENFHYTTCEDLLDEIHSSARAYYRFACNMSQHISACRAKTYKFKIEVTETLQGVFDVEAENLEQAIEKIEEQIKDETNYNRMVDVLLSKGL